MVVRIAGHEVKPGPRTCHLIVLLLEREQQIEKAADGGAELHWSAKTDEVSVQLRELRRSRSTDAEARLASKLGRAVKSLALFALSPAALSLLDVLDDGALNGSWLRPFLG